MSETLFTHHNDNRNPKTPIRNFIREQPALLVGGGAFLIGVLICLFPWLAGIAAANVYYYFGGTMMTFGACAIFFGWIVYKEM